MSKKYLSIVSLFAFLMPLITLLAQKDNWVLRHEKNGVKTFFREKKGGYEVKFMTSIQTSLSGFTKLLNDVEQYPIWGYKVKEARLLKKISDNEMYYYTRIDLPWPLEDRDFVLHTIFTQYLVARRVESINQSVPNFIPPVPGVVRVQHTISRWTLTPTSGGMVKTEYYLDSDPGGSLPNWLVNMGLEMGPLEMFKSINVLLKKPAYRDLKIAGIKE